MPRRSARPTAGTGGRPTSSCATPATATGGCCSTPTAASSGSTRPGCTRSRPWMPRTSPSSPTPAPPAWLFDSVMYQVFPDRFARSAAADERPTPDWAIPADWSDPVDPVAPARSQQFYGGDLDGVDRASSTISSSLGVNLLYLTPVFPAASNHRYDAASFDRVDPLLGGDEAYIRLIEAAHARGIRVIGDLTSNHSGDTHEWFRAAYGNPGAPEEEFYYFTDAGNTEYVSWLGYASLPKFDWSSPELRRRFIDGRGLGRRAVAQAAVRHRRLAHRRREHDRAARRRRPQRRGAAARCARRWCEINPDTILLGRVDERRGERPAGRRLARRDDLSVVHAAGVGLAERARPARPTSTRTASSRPKPGSSASRSAASRATPRASSSTRSSGSPPASRGACAWATCSRSTRTTPRASRRTPPRARSRSRSGCR